MTYLEETIEQLKRTKPEMFEMVDNDPVLQEIDRKAKKPTCPNRKHHPRACTAIQRAEEKKGVDTWLIGLADWVWYPEWQNRQFLFKNKSTILEVLKKELELLKSWEKELLLDRVCKHKFKDMAKRFNKTPAYLGKKYKSLLLDLKYRIREVINK